MKPAVLVLVLAVACGRGSSTPSPLAVEAVRCLVPRGVPLHDGKQAYDHDLVGPDFCARSLELWLDAHPDDRIASVLPLEYSAADSAGTQELLVVHTAGDGPWPRARDLEVSIPLSPLCRTTTEPGRYDAHSCQNAVAGLLPDTGAGAVLWVPIAGAVDDTVQTQEILAVVHRGTGTVKIRYPDAGRPAVP